MGSAWSRVSTIWFATAATAIACAGRSVDDSGGVGNDTGGRGGRGGNGGNTGGWYCFEAGTRVATPQGSVPIERLREGDEVLAFDDRSASVVARRVTATFVHAADQSGRLALEDGRTLRVTPEHPIYSAELGDYVPAREFAGNASVVTLSETLGSKLARNAVTRPHSRSLGLTRIEPSGFESFDAGAPVLVYNISVADLENYFVEGVLVHNKTAAYGGGGYGGTYGGSIGVTGGTGCDPAPPAWGAGGCPFPDRCLIPGAEYVRLNQPAEPGTGGEGPGAGGESGAPDDTAVDGTTVLATAVCSPPTSESEERYLAVDFLMPSVMSGVTGYAVFDGGPCAGQEIGQVWLSDYDVPPVGSWTTQCTRLLGSEHSTLLSLHVLDGRSRLKNPRLVEGCECYRELKRSTTCGIAGSAHGGGSACEAF